MSILDRAKYAQLKKQEFSIKNLFEAYRSGKIRDYLKDKKNIKLYDNPELQFVNGDMVIVSERDDVENKYESKKYDIFTKRDNSVISLRVEQQQEYFIANGSIDDTGSYHTKIPAESKVALMIDGRILKQEVIGKYFGFDEENLHDLCKLIKDPTLRAAFDIYVCKGPEGVTRERIRDDNTPKETSEKFLKARFCDYMSRNAER